MSSIHDPQPTFPSSNDVLLRERLHALNVTSSVEATALAEQGQQATYLGLVWAPFFAFMRVYFRQGEWRHGIPGFITALFTSYSVFIRHTKLWEKQNVKTTVPPPQF